MSADAALEAQLAEETRAKQRRHILSSTRARWIFVSVAAAGHQPDRFWARHRDPDGGCRRLDLEPLLPGIADAHTRLRRLGADAHADRESPAGDARDAGPS